MQKVKSLFGHLQQWTFTDIFQKIKIGSLFGHNGTKRIRNFIATQAI